MHSHSIAEKNPSLFDLEIASLQGTTLPTPFQQIIHQSKYARWDDIKQRRETWFETVYRYISFFRKRYEGKIKDELWVEAFKAILNLEISPSMRALWAAGKALEKDEICNYNCSYLAIDHPRAFSEAFFLLLAGAGVGFSVERQEIVKLPEVPEEIFPSDSVIIVKDSKLGWVQAFNELISLLYSGRVPKWDLKLVRPTGSRMKTFGGRACLSGDTIVYKDKGTTRGRNEITIKQLYQMKHSLGFWEHKSNHFKDVRLRALDESTGTFFRNNLLDVIDNGEQAVYEVITEKGYRIKATDNHRFMTESGEYAFLSEFSEGDFIAVNGSEFPRPNNCIDCNEPISIRAQRCKACVDKKQTIIGSRNNQVKLYQKSLKESCESCSHNGSKSELQVHYIDGNRWNNVPENWLTLCESCHRKLHNKQWTDGNPYSHRYLSFDKIVSIEYSGIETVYDLVMRGPNHNFIANGFVSHNSGPRPLDELFKTTVQTFKNARGRKLTSFECHNLMTSIAATVQVGGSRRCLFNETEVELENGQTISLKNMKVGYTIKAGDGTNTTVTNIFDNGLQEIVKVHLEDGTFFECTENHRWYVYNVEQQKAEFVEAKDLNKRMFFMFKDGVHNVNEIVDIEYTKEIKPVMDIEVSHPNHQFLAISLNGARGISHNSALISLSNLSDERMRDCKTGQWWEQNPNLSFANNSVAYTEKPDIGIFMKEWLSLYMSKSGERGIFNRQGAKKHIKEGGRRDPDHEFGLNPCGEVILRKRELCNLTSVILRPTDDYNEVKRKISLATFLGTIQSGMTNFRFLSKEWKKNCEEEHLMVVSLSGIMDHPFFSTLEKEFSGFDLPLEETLKEFQEFTFTENEKFAAMIGISPSVSTTGIKPEGNSSSLNNSSPGIHPRYSPYYIRSIRFDNHDSLAKMLKDQGVPNEPDVMKPETTTVFYFPIKSPENSIFVKDISALEQLELYKIYKTHYTTHNPSITVYVKENEWLEVGAWVYKNFDILSGVSFLPNVEHNYSQLPYQEVSKEDYEEQKAKFPEIDWSLLKKYETDDNTTGSIEYACVGGACALD